jgi:hypothetical protein
MPKPAVLLRRLALPLLLASAAPAWGQAGANACGSLANGTNGPFDYRVERGPRLKVVEEFHFNSRVESLVGGQSGSIASDLDYVLRAFPNHHRALVAMTRLARRHNSPVAPAAPLSVDCYFDRALRFQPDDTVARMLFASHLSQSKRADAAVGHLERVVSLAQDNAFTHYNVGMLYAEMALYDRALEHAHKALQLGFARSDLKAKLQAAGKWVEPPEQREAAPAASAASAPTG